jgi:hypothetical protein
VPAATAVAAHLQTRRQRSAGDGRVDRGELLLGEGHASLGRGHRVRAAHLRERGEPVVDDPEEVVEVRVAVGRCEERTSRGILRSNAGATLEAVRWRILFEVQEPFQKLDEFLLSWCGHVSDARGDISGRSASNFNIGLEQDNLSDAICSQMFTVKTDASG